MQFYPRVVYRVLEGYSVIIRGSSKRIHKADLDHTLIHKEICIYCFYILNYCGGFWPLMPFLLSYFYTLTL